MTHKTAINLLFTLATLLLAAVVHAAEPSSASGKVLSRSAFELPAFEQLPKVNFGAVSAKAYARLKQVADGRLERITYLSQGLKVNALVLAPTNGTERAAVIVYCKGGVGPAAVIGLGSPFVLYEMSRYAEAGFFVIAPQYRGVDGGEGKDEVGGDDLNDVLAIPELLKSFEQADTDSMLLVGSSRGGMMALQAVRAGFPARGVVLNGAPTDWELAFAHNPRLRQIAETMWPDYKADAAAAITRRSAARWAQEINVPLLVHHGGADPIVHPAVVLDFASKLTALGKPYDLAIYAGDDHPIFNHAEERLVRTIEWVRTRVR
jgi:dipeptidyl aminopeptidase/acylaminoacyl peptidase